MANKKVVAINSSRRKKNTYGIIESIGQGLQKEDIEVEIIHLFDYQVEDCRGCERCLREGNCIIDDDMENLMDKLINADGLIISSPVYMGTVSGRLKTFLDRTCVWFHRPQLVGKPALTVATTAGSGLKSTLKYLEKVSIEWGMQPTEKIGRSAVTMQKPIQEKEYQDFINHLYMDQEEYRPTLKQLISYQVQKVLALKLLKIDRDYWQEKGWASSLFYFDGSISIFKKIFAGAFYKMLDARIEPVEESS